MVVANGRCSCLASRKVLFENIPLLMGHWVCIIRKLWSRWYPVIFGTVQFDGKEVAGEMYSNTVAGVISWSQEQWNTKDKGLDSCSQEESKSRGKDHSSFLPLFAVDQRLLGPPFLLLFWMGGFIEVFLCPTVMCYEWGVHLVEALKQEASHRTIMTPSCVTEAMFV